MKKITEYDTKVQMKNYIHKDEYVLPTGDTVRVRAVYQGQEVPFFAPTEMHKWKVTLSTDQNSLIVDFYSGLLKHRVTALDVLWVLQRESWIIIEETENYEDFCSVLGYDPEDYNSHYAYGMTCRQVRNLQTFFGPKLFPEFLDDETLKGL